MGARFRRRPQLESEGKIGMKNIRSLLNANKDISGYRVMQTKTESYELFFVHE